jgi:hypothetical protein
MEKQNDAMDKKSFFFAGAAFRDNHPFCNPAEKNFKHRKNERPKRPDTTSFDQQDAPNI